MPHQAVQAEFSHSINKPFKHAIRKQFEKHLSENLHLYTENKLPVSERRELTTKWVA